MPSMSYCMFENTSIEMRQIINSMQESETWDALDLNETEKHGFFNLMLQCSEFLVFANEMLLNEEADVESRGGTPSEVADLVRYHRVKRQIRMSE